jgi:hypothetical protein
LDLLAFALTKASALDLGSFGLLRSASMHSAICGKLLAVLLSMKLFAVADLPHRLAAECSLQAHLEGGTSETLDE